MRRVRPSRKQPRETAKAKRSRSAPASSHPSKKTPTRGPKGGSSREPGARSEQAPPERARRERARPGRSDPSAEGTRSGSSGTGRAPGRGSGSRKKRSGRAMRRPAVRPEVETLLQLEELLQQRIVGKNEAIQRVANAIRIRKTNLDFRPQRPDGTFLLVGPPGVGKSEFAHAVAEVLMGDESLVIDLDMADYTEEEDVEDLLVTAYPGVDGLMVEGTLTTPMRKNPRSVILFHGIERAHPAVLRLMMHVVERGVLSDAQGEVRFDEAIVFATTRLLYEDGEVVQQIGFNRSTTPREDRIRRLLEDQFSPELVAAFNEVLFFKKLTAEDVRMIARYKVGAVLERLKKQKRGVIISDRVWDTFIWEDEVQKAGARYLNRALEERLFTPLSKYLLEHNRARRITVDVRDRRLVIRHDSS